MRIMTELVSPSQEECMSSGSSGGSGGSGGGSVDEERRARSLALEKAYVHDVYDQIADEFMDGRHKAWPRVKQFLLDLEPGSIVADIGCGNGKYLNINPSLCMVGSDRCSRLVSYARTKTRSRHHDDNGDVCNDVRRGKHHVVVSDNLNLPFREDTFDAVLSIAVVHHFSTTERRVQALRELARVLKIGGRVIISVWAKEQRQRKLESQDVLVPWHRHVKTSSEDCGSSADCDRQSTTTSDEDILTYHAHTVNTSDSGDSGCKNTNSNPFSRNKRSGYCNENVRNRGWARSALPRQNSSQSSSDLSSPNETCYSFVRRALKRFSSGSIGPSSYGSLASLQCYRTCKRPWLVAYNSFDSDIPPRPRGLNNADSANGLSTDSSFNSEDIDRLPIELRDLDDVIIRNTKPALASSNPSGFVHPIKSKSLGDILGMLHMFLRPKKSWSSLSSDSCSSESWSLRSLKRKKQSKNGMVKSISSFGFLARNDAIFQKAITKSDEIQETDLLNDNSTKHTTTTTTTTKNVELSSNDRINGNTIVPEMTTKQLLDKITPNIMDIDKSSWIISATKSVDGPKPVAKSLDDDVVQKVNKRNRIISEDLMKHNLLLFTERCSRLSREKEFEYYLNEISRFRSMPNLRFRSSNQGGVRKQASLDEQVLFDTSQNYIDMPKSWLDHFDCEKNGVNKNKDELELELDREQFASASILKHLKGSGSVVQTTMDDTCQQLLKPRRTNGTKRHISCDDTALLSSSGLGRSQHIWTVPGRTVLAALGRPPGGLSPRLSTGSSSQQSDTSFDSEDSIVSVIAAKPVDGESSESRRELHDSFEDPIPDQSDECALNSVTDMNDPSQFNGDICQIRSSNAEHQRDTLNKTSSEDTISPTNSSSSEDFLQSSVIENKGSLNQQENNENMCDAEVVKLYSCLENDEGEIIIKNTQDGVGDYYKIVEQNGAKDEGKQCAVRLKHQHSLDWGSGGVDDENFGKLEFICDDVNVNGSSGGCAIDKRECGGGVGPNLQLARQTGDNNRSSRLIDGARVNCTKQVHVVSENIRSPSLSSSVIEDDSGGSKITIENSNLSAENELVAKIDEDAKVLNGGDALLLEKNEKEESDAKTGLGDQYLSDLEEDCGSQEDEDGMGNYDSSRRNSLSSDGGAAEDFTFHRYYHVFREGELDQLIDNHVDNLHIISSYYDHANWCIIAEKVQVWTI